MAGLRGEPSDFSEGTVSGTAREETVFRHLKRGREYVEEGVDCSVFLCVSWDPD